MEIFRLFGSILVDNASADASIAATDGNAQGLHSRFSEGISTAGKWALGISAAAGTAALGIGIMAMNMSQDLEKALNGVQASTGASVEEMNGMKDAMLDIYNSGFGESFDDIGNSMTTIAQQTKLSGEELAKTTKNALAVKDTFGIEVSESIRSANQLMKNFGLTSDEAYNYIAQGAQGGLNANENLADSINEYSVHFKNIGLSADDMFNMMKNGADSGVFDIDKLGDAIKEFGIRSKDGSKGTMEAFKSLGLNASQISADFASGGEKGKAAFELVTSKLNEMKDPLAKNTTGTALFGTMWEDMGAKGIEALTKTNGGISGNVDALSKINNVKYDTFGEAMTGIGRQLKTGILLPIGDEILPILNKFAKYINEHMPQIKEVIHNVMSIVGGVFKSSSGVIENFAKKIMPMIGEAFDFVVKNVIPPFVEIFNFVLKEVVPPFVKAFQDWFPKIKDIFKDMYDNLKIIFDLVKVVFDATFPYVKEIVKVAVDSVIKTIDNLLKVFNGILDFVAGVFSGDWKRAWGGIKDIFEGIIKQIVVIVGGLFTIGIDFLKAFWSGLYSIGAWLIGKVIEFFASIVKSITDAVKDFLQAGKDIFNAVWDGIKAVYLLIVNWVSEKVLAIVKIYIDAVKSFLQAGKDIFNAVWDGIKAVYLLIAPWIGTTITAIVKLYIDAVKRFLQVGIDIFNAVWDGIKAVYLLIEPWVSTTITAIVGFFTNSIATFTQAGKDIFTGVWDGIKSVWTNISNWVTEKITWLTDKLSFWKTSQSTMSGGTTTTTSIKARAVGGPVNANEPYLVGENGPELYIPNNSGTIIPNNKLSNTGGSKNNIQIVLTGNTIMNDSDADALGDLLIRRLKALGV